MAVGRMTKQYRQRLIDVRKSLESMPDEEYKYLASKSGTLHFVDLLGFQAIPDRRSIKNGEKQSTIKKVGITLFSDEEIEVPVIDILKNHIDGIDYKTDVTFRRVKPQEYFHLSFLELMCLIVRDEYCGYFEANNDPRGGIVSFYWKDYDSGKAKLPTTTVRFKPNRRTKISPKHAERIVPIKANIIPIDKNDSGYWEIKAGYEKFGPLLEEMLKEKVKKKERSIQALRELNLMK